MLRYKSMQGYCVPRQAGFDCHGLPVELAVQKELGLCTVADVEAYGVDRFNEACRARVLRFRDEWTETTKRMAYWCDLAHPYFTADATYMESVWQAVRQLHDQGLLYKAFTVLDYSPETQCTYSSQEVQRKRKTKMMMMKTKQQNKHTRGIKVVEGCTTNMTLWFNSFRLFSSSSSFFFLLLLFPPLFFLLLASSFFFFLLLSSSSFFFFLLLSSSFFFFFFFFVFFFFFFFFPLVYIIVRWTMPARK